MTIVNVTKHSATLFQQ